MEAVGKADKEMAPYTLLHVEGHGEALYLSCVSPNQDNQWQQRQQAVRVQPYPLVFSAASLVSILLPSHLYFSFRCLCHF